MANNIVETIQKNLQYDPLQKVDPNIQDTKDKHIHSPAEKLAQAAIPAVLAALYAFSKDDARCTQVIGGSEHEDWLSVIYEGKEAEAVEKVARYAGVAPGEAEHHMENIADEAIKVVKESVGTNPTTEKVRAYMSSQRHNILVYLPAALNIGDTLNNDQLDDKTNKMEGPISNFMHKIENTLSKNDTTKYP